MHGRKRGQIDDVTRAKMVKKAGMFQELSTIIAKSRDKGDRSEKALELTSKMLSMNPDCYSWWNYRREILLDLYGGAEELGLTMEAPSGEEAKVKTSRDESKAAAVRDTELQLTVEGIMKNPKSYPAWSHRQWIIQRFECDYGHEMKLCSEMLNLDQRNFHCWNYRRWVSDISKRSFSKELEYCYEKIEQNFSNYSAFHHRSVYFRDLHKEKSFREIIPLLKVEFAIVENATFTDPYDQSAWWYHRFLVKHLERQEGVSEEDGSAAKGVLAEQRELYHSLAEHEPGCKWTLDALLHILSMQERWGEGQEVEVRESLLAKLREVDPLRIGRFQ